MKEEIKQPKLPRRPKRTQKHGYKPFDPNDPYEGLHYTDQIGQKFIELSELGYSVPAAAGHLGFSKRTIYHWRNRIPEFAEIFEIARCKRMFHAETDIMDAETSAKVTSAIFRLKAIDPEQYRETYKIESKVEHNHSLNLENLSEDELFQLMQLAQKAEQPMLEYDDSEEADYEEIE